MSKCHEEQIKCPCCGTTCDFTIWDSIDIDLNPELRKHIMTEDIFTWRCPLCGKVMYVPYQILYHDKKDKFMLFYIPEAPKQGIYDAWELSNSIEPTMRVVYGLMNFKEKIAILEQGLNDIAIERMKYMISHVVCPEIAQKDYKLYFKGTEGEEEEFPFGKISFFYEDVEKEKIVTTRFAMDNYYEHCMAVDIDPRMQIGGKCICIDSGWMDIKLKKS